MGLDEVEYLDQKSAIERAKYRIALSIKDYAALIFFDGDASGYLCQDMQAIANNQHIILWYSADFIKKHKNGAYQMLADDNHSTNGVAITLFWEEETSLLNYILFYRVPPTTSLALENSLSQDGKRYGTDNLGDRKIYGEILEGSINISIDKNKLKFDSYGKMINRQYQDEVRPLIIENISSKTNIPVGPTEDEIRKLEKFYAANKFINNFIKEALIEHKISYEPEGKIIPELERSILFKCQYDIEFFNEKGLPCRESAETIKVKKNIVAEYILSNYGRWTRATIKDTSLAEVLELEDQRKSKIKTLKAEAGIAVESKEACNEEDLKHWCRQPFWTIEECVFLLLGKKPKVEASGLFGPRSYREPWKPKEFDQIKETAFRHIEANKLPLKPAPKEFVTWAINMGYEVPAQLLDAIFPKSIKPITEKDSFSLEVNQRSEPEAGKKETEEANTFHQGYKLLSDKNQNTMMMFGSKQKNLIEQPKQKTASEMGKKGAQKTHARTAEAKEEVKKIAEDLIARKEGTEEVRTNDIVKETYSIFSKGTITNNGKPYAKSTIETWVKEMNIIPEKMKKPGRPPRKPKILEK